MRGLRSVLLVLLGSCLAWTSARTFAADPPQNESAEIKRIERQLKDGSLPEPPMWTLIHMADEKEKMTALRAFCSEEPDVAEIRAALDLATIFQKAGGLAKYRQRIAELLDSRDATVRGFAAVWLADLGDPAYTKNILALLESEDLPDAGGDNKNWDRGQAAFALGILGAREHAPAIAKYLSHDDKYLRAGAARGLGQMNAKGYEKDIAALLQEKDEGVACTAIWALGRLGAREFGGQIVALLETDHPGVFNAPGIAWEALVELDAKDQAPRIAKLLGDRTKGGQAAKTLALLEARQYAPEIAELADRADVYNGADAIIALGILRDAQYAREAGWHLQDQRNGIRHAAAWAVIMMGAKPYAQGAIEIVRAAREEHVDLLRSSGGRGIPPDRLKQLDRQFSESLARLEKGQ